MDGGERPTTYVGTRGGPVTRPANLAGSTWADWAAVRVELGVVDSWTPSGGEWDGGLWDKALWGQSYLTPNVWLDVTADVMSLDLDTGRNGVDDPGDVGSASVVLYDPEGDYSIAGVDRSAIGNLLRVSVDATNEPSSRITFHGKVTEASAVGDLSAASTTIRAIDLLGALLSTDDADGLDAQTVEERLNDLCGRASVPAELRDISPDTTTLLPVVMAGNRLDAARGAAASSVGGTLWATGDGVIRYRFGAFLVAPATAPRYLIGTAPGYTCPSALDLAEQGADVRNVYDWTNQDRETPLNAAATDADSVRRFGRSASVRTDLLNSDPAELRALVQAEIARTAWSPDRVDSCSIPIHDDATARLATVAIGDLIDFAYTGSAPWTARQLVGSYAHHISPDEWTVDIRAYPAIVVTQWDTAEWDIDTWSLGGDLATS